MAFIIKNDFRASETCGERKIVLSPWGVFRRKSEMTTKGDEWYFFFV